MDDFESTHIQAGETNILVRWSGSGPPVPLLHGFPQTHLMWRSVAPQLAQNSLSSAPIFAVTGAALARTPPRIMRHTQSVTVNMTRQTVRKGDV